MGGGGSSLNHPGVWIGSLLMWLLLPWPIPHACNHLPICQQPACTSCYLCRGSFLITLIIDRILSALDVSQLDWSRKDDSKMIFKFFTSDSDRYARLWSVDACRRCSSFPFPSPLLPCRLCVFYGFFWPEASKSRTCSLVDVECLYKKYKGVVTNHWKS